jgi:hypothetical protein
MKGADLQQQRGQGGNSTPYGRGMASPPYSVYHFWTYNRVGNGGRTMNERWARIYLQAMAAYWLIFGLITIFLPGLMGLFQSPAGVAARTDFSDHVWTHDGLDILAVAVLVFVSSRVPLNRQMLGAAGVAALLPAVGIANSLISTPYWNPLFIVPFVGCFAFAILGLALAIRRAPAATA